MTRRTILEIAAKYKLNPTVREIFVEGTFDKIVFRWFLDSAKIKEVTVVEIQLIDIPDVLFKKHGLTSGEKARVIVLGKELAALFGPKASQAICVVDADCDRLLRKVTECELVFLTDYSCMEMYYVQVTTLQKYFQASLGCNEVDVELLLRQYSRVLRELFLIRAANEELGLALRWIPFDMACRVEAEGITFDAEKFIRHLLQNSQSYDSYEPLVARIEELRPRLDDDIRNHSNGHDFFALLNLHYGREAKQRGLPNAAAVSTALRGCLNHSQIEDEVLFSTLKRLLVLDAPQPHMLPT